MDFGRKMLKDTVEKDSELKAIYDETDQAGAYLIVAEQVLEGIDNNNVINSRLQAERTPLETNEQEINDEFKVALDKVVESEDGGNLEDVSQCVSLYLQFSEPRASKIEPEYLELFLEIISKTSDSMKPDVATSIYEDVLQSGMSLTSRELTLWASLFLNEVPVVDEQVIAMLKAGVTTMGHQMNITIYNELLRACLLTDQFSLFESLLEEISEAKLEPDRSTLRLMTKYAGDTKDLNALLNLILDIRINGDYKHYLDSLDFAVLFEALINCGKKNVANDILNIIVLLRDSYREAGGSLPLDHPDLTVTSSDLEIDRPLELYDMVVPDQELIDFYPQLDSVVLSPFYQKLESLQELESLDIICKENNIEKDSDIFTNEFELIHKSRVELAFPDFQKIMFDIFEQDQEKHYLSILISNEEILKYFVETCEYFAQAGAIDGNNDEIVGSFKIIWEFLEDFQHIDATEEDALTDLISAIVTLVR
ncbi:unnamed protein product [Ambrosiozyma monospora]|uniref:Unnamed protein product n=1 Tax=Ambrosiozyma monospora TaxID=43982 RepID=A0A9W6Z1P8_AMBMO|nr:unnamed protein product [Ambrosiozyma monospora]